MNSKINEIPQYVIDGIARLLLPEIRKSYEYSEDTVYLPEQENESDNSANTNS